MLYRNIPILSDRQREQAWNSGWDPQGKGPLERKGKQSSEQVSACVTVVLPCIGSVALAGASQGKKLRKIQKEGGQPRSLRRLWFASRRLLLSGAW